MKMGKIKHLMFNFGLEATLVWLSVKLYKKYIIWYPLLRNYAIFPLKIQFLSPIFGWNIPLNLKRQSIIAKNATIRTIWGYQFLKIHTMDKTVVYNTIGPNCGILRKNLKHFFFRKKKNSDEIRPMNAVTK